VASRLPAFLRFYRPRRARKGQGAWNHAIDLDIGFPQLHETHQVRERERSCVADLVTRVGGHPDERLVWNRRRRQRVPSAVCLRYSTGRVYEVPSFPTVAVCLF